MTKVTNLPSATTLVDKTVFVIVDGADSRTKKISWETLRTGGLKGDTGNTGTTGTIGPVGPMGTIATLKVGTVTIASTTTTASVVISASNNPISITTILTTATYTTVLPVPVNDIVVANSTGIRPGATFQLIGTPSLIVTGVTDNTVHFSPSTTISTSNIATSIIFTNLTGTTSTNTASTGLYYIDFVVPKGATGATGVVSWSALTNSMIPETDKTFNIGDSTHRWNDTYISRLNLNGVVIASTGSQVTTALAYNSFTDSTSTNYGNPTTHITVVDSSNINSGDAFTAYLDQGLQSTILGSGVVNYVIDREVFFTDPVVFTSSFAVGSRIVFSGPQTVSLNGTPITYTLTTATATAVGGIKVGSGLTITSTGTLSTIPYVLNTATGVTVGGVKIGTGIRVAADGTISVTTGSFALQTATNIILGGVKIGHGIDAAVDGTISVNTASAGTLTGTELASNVVSSSLTSVGQLTSLDVIGITTLRQTAEVYTTINGATGPTVHDCSGGTIFLHNSPTSNWTANFTNVTFAANRMVSMALLINQGVTPYLPTVVQYNGVPITIKWQGGITPTGNANKVDLVNFTFVVVGSSTSLALGSLSSFG